MSKRLIVTGGDGFIGRHVCRIAVEQGHEVTSISRSGRGAVEGPWAERVRWIAADILQPETWRDYLQGAEAVIHCVGAIRENRRMGRTYERINSDSTEMVAWEAEHANVPRFVFLSADTPKQIVPDRFIEAKRRAEMSLRRSSVQESILRPTFVFGPERPSTMVGAQVLRAADRVPGLHEIVHPNRPLRVEQVALAAVRAAVDDGYGGVISVDNIEYLAGEDWQRYAERRNGHRASPSRTLLIGSVVAGVVAGVAWKLLSRR